MVVVDLVILPPLFFSDVSLFRAASFHNWTQTRLVLGPSCWNRCLLCSGRLTGTPVYTLEWLSSLTWPAKQRMWWLMSTELVKHVEHLGRPKHLLFHHVTFMCSVLFERQLLATLGVLVSTFNPDFPYTCSNFCLMTTHYIWEFICVMIMLLNLLECTLTPLQNT